MKTRTFTTVVRTMLHDVNLASDYQTKIQSLLDQIDQDVASIFPDIQNGSYIDELIRAGKTIEAIKQYRETVTGCDLFAAKMKVDKHRAGILRNALSERASNG